MLSTSTSGSKRSRGVKRKLGWSARAWTRRYEDGVCKVGGAAVVKKCRFRLVVETLTPPASCSSDVLTPPAIPKEQVVETKSSLMTEEEERELAELMDSDIDEDI